jgi:ferredoxin--NADP+ reductase
MERISDQLSAGLVESAETRDNWTSERVIAIRQWTPTLLSFRTTRYRAFRFTPGHYTRLGLGSDEATVWRPFSMVSAATDEYLEFVAVLVPDGAFTQHLSKLRVGDPIRVDKAAFGFLTVDQLAPGRDLWMLASGSGLGPFLSILRDPAIWQNFRHLILVHSVRQPAELAYRQEIEQKTRTTDRGPARLSYLPVVTRQPGATALGARLPQLLTDGSLERVAGANIEVTGSRLMICGNPEMSRAIRQELISRKFASTRRGVPGQMAFEKYW